MIGSRLRRCGCANLPFCRRHFWRASADPEPGLLPQVTLALLIDAAERRLAPRWIDPSLLRSPTWGPHLHRWGGAFPTAPLLAFEHAVVPSARVAFVGDFIEGPRAGSIEGAFLSGQDVASALLTEIAREVTPIVPPVPSESLAMADGEPDLNDWLNTARL